MQPTPAHDLSSLAAAVRERRRALGLRQDEVADLADVSERFVHTVEAGKPTVRVDKLLDVLRVLGLSLHVQPGRGTVTAPDRDGDR